MGSWTLTNMPHHYIPFANYPDLQVVSDLYPQAAGCRVTLRSLRKAKTADLPTAKLWVDAEVDGYSPEVFDASKNGYEGYRQYREYIQKFAGHGELLAAQDKTALAGFVNAVLDSVLEAASTASNLGYVSVPQLPYIPGSDRNKINRMLAEFTLRWKSTQRRPPRLILPVIFAKNLGQTDTKTDRRKKVELAVSCFEASGADGIWVVDSTLDDHAGLKKLENQRLPGIIHFHEEINAKLPPDTVTIGGPYWGLNLALWSRGLVRFPAIGVGSYRYYVPGRLPKSASVRVAVPPLKRLVVGAALRPWLQDALVVLGKSDPARRDLASLLKDLAFLQTKEHARKRIAGFYRDWLVKLESVPASSRALTLYQDFSAAFVLGSKLGDFGPPEDVPDPAIIAKQLMVNCL
jgi:hypothetical protein